MKFEFHPLLQDVPLMPLHERDALANDIKENGQRFPIVLIGGKIIDGRNRYLACLSRDIMPKTIELNGQEPKAFVASANYFRKHWTTSERSHFAALMSLESERGSPETKSESNSSNEPLPSITQVEAAKKMGVSVSSVKRAKAKIRGKSNAKRTEPTKQTDVDVDGKEIPTAAKAYWNRKAEANNVLNQIRAAKGQVKKLMPDDPMYCEVNLNGVMSDLNTAINRFAAAIPAHVCPYCKGVKPDNCKACKGRGVVSEYFWKTAVPKEMKPEMPF